MVRFDLDKLNKLLGSLKEIPNVREVRELRKRLQKEQRKILKPTVRAATSTQKTDANLRRSGKLKRYHNYIRQIRNNFPNLSYRQIQNQFKKRKEGEQVSIPDVVFQNPSP